MPRISEIEIQNVRCFNSVQRANLGRITLLVGENNVGKSTFLGCYNAFANLSNFVDLPGGNPFDFPPFSMGSYDTIARSGTSDFTVAGKYDSHIHSAARFCFGRSSNRKQLFEKHVAFTFSGKGKLPTHINIATSNGEGGREGMRLSFQGPDFNFHIDRAEISFVPISTWLSRNVRQGHLPYNADMAIFKKRKVPPSKEIVEFGKFINFFRSEMPLPGGCCFHVNALEPNIPPRKRRYQEPPRYMRDAADRASLIRAGSTLGLWQNLELDDAISGVGTEVNVTIVGGSYNLFDVGYGVHSLLPLVNTIANAEVPSIFLLQQPEVHVHPVAQAKLAQYMAEGPHDFIIETHSDHLVDRFRLCVMKQVLRPDELAILYFEKDKDCTETKIYNISVDSQGNIVNPPDSYREFFLTETERLLGLQ